MSYFHIILFIFLLIVICLAVTHIIVLHQEYLYHCFGLSDAIFPSTQVVSHSNQTSGRIANSVDITQNLCMLFSVYTTIIFTNPFINQAGSYYNDYLILPYMGQMLVMCCYIDNIVVITLNLGSASVSGNNNDIILAMEYTVYVRY